MTAAGIAERLHARRSGAGWVARCPAHDDRTPSLSITERDSKILLHCHAGCSVENVLAAAGLQMSDLFRDAKVEKRIIATYDYTDESGKLLFQTVRFEPKDFKQRRPDGHGGWRWGLASVRRVLYRLPDVLNAESVLVVEGEKDCETGRKLGLVATTNACGSKAAWRPEYSEWLRSKRIAIICDADTPGLEHGWKVARSLAGIAASIRVIERLPGVGEKGDLTEWVNAGGTRELLLKIILEARKLTPAEMPKEEPTNQTPNGFKLMPLADLLSKPSQPVEYVWEGRLALGTVSGLVGKPKVGKGTLARNLFLAVARGEEFLGSATRQGDCIYLALEERAEDIRADFAAMGADGTEPILIHAAAAPSEGIRELCKLVRERKPRLVAIDPLFRLARIRDEKAYAETYAELGPLIDAARETGTHIFLLHHSGKSLKADPIDSPLGSTAIGGAVSTLIVLKRTETYRTVQTVQRIGEDMPETVLQFDPETRRLSLAGTREDADTQTAGKGILEFLEAAAEPKTEPEINEAVEGKTKFVRRALRQLVEQGKVSREGGGKKGNPYKYGFSFSCSLHIAGTREQETQNPPEPRENTEEKLVPTMKQQSLLVPDTEKPEKQAVLEGEI